MKYTHRFLFVGLLILAFGCSWISPLPLPTEERDISTAVAVTPSPQVDDSDTLTTGHLVISELLPGVKGNNNYEFIELYNPGNDPIEIQNWSVWFRMADNQDEKLIHKWTSRTDVPAYGHYLLVREGQDFDIIPDIVFTTPIFERKGGLVLRDADSEPVDIVGWGDAPSGYYENTPASTPGGEASLERNPGGEQGNGIDSNDNASDFSLAKEPNPQGLASEITPLPSERLEIWLETVETISPGKAFDVEVTVKNNTKSELVDIDVVFPISAGMDFVDALPQSDVIRENESLSASWSLKVLPVGDEASWILTLRSPWSYELIKFVGYYTESQDTLLRRYGRMIPLAVEGGAIPIETARTLTGQVVTIEGIATMYTGGYYAGGTGTKFYIDDGTGGIQVYCPGGMGVVYVDIGDNVRVTGLIEVYRDSVEIIPERYPDHVEILSEENELVPSIVSTVASAKSDNDIIGRLITVEGQVTRLEEFTYSYEIDLMDELGNTVLVYLDNESYISPDFIEVGNLYRISGILEKYNTIWQLKPRLASDFVEVFPEELMLEMMAQNSIASNGTITYTITAYNHTVSPLQDLIITANIPKPPAVLDEILENGTLELSTIVWVVPKIEQQGGHVSVGFSVTAGEDGIVEMLPAEVSAEAYPDLVNSNPWMTFIGSGVPIWAIQGEDFSSPFVRSVASTEGVVTGIFQELQGFWIQSLIPDDNPATSEGLFIATDEGNLPITPGDHVLVTGKIREKSGQTQLSLAELDDLTILASGLPLPEPQELDPPVESDQSKTYFETLEGMLVKVTEPAQVIAPVTKYGEYVLVLQSWDIDRVMRGEPKGMMIFVDDGSEITHYDQSMLPYAVKTGDQVGDIVGPLAYTYENYKIQPISTPTVTATVTLLPKLPDLAENEYSIATLNGENYFDIMDPHPSDPPRPSIKEYRLKTQKMAETILSMGVPTIIGFQEVENLSVLEDLAQHELIAVYSYIPVLSEGLDSRGIDVGYLVRGDQADVLSVTQYPAPEGLTSRPPLVIEISLKQDSAHQIFVINNHFTSMSAGELATEPQRNAQAAWNVTLVESILNENPDALIAVIGDLNSFYDSPPLDTLRKGRLTHVYEFVAPIIPYTYIYQGESETIDHILVTPELYAQIQSVDVLHTNADYPPLDPDDDSAQRVSDHDPLVVVFRNE